MKIGLVGEAPNDTLSIQYLLEQKYSPEDYEYCFLLDRIHGSQLDNQKTKRFLRIEYESKKPDLIIFIRDLDSLLPNKDKVSERKAYFTSFNRVVDRNGIFLLNIYEIEALILADIKVFNRIYNCDIQEIENPMEVEGPKEYLKQFSNEYSESQNSDIFQEIKIEKACGCKYFGDFITEFDRKIIEFNN